MAHARPLAWRGLRLESRSSRIVWLGVVPAAAVLAVLLVNVYRAPEGASTSRPDVALVIRGLAHPTVSVQNRSGTIAQNVGLQLSLWDLDHRASAGTADPAKLFTPAFPTRSVHPRGLAGPWPLATATGTLTPGHVVFGHASIDCRDCGQRRDYWVWLKVGERGWLKEFSNGESSAQLLTRVLLAGEGYSAVIDELAPPAERTPIYP
jgi:hypothetical protein